MTHFAQDEADVDEDGHEDEKRDGPDGNLCAVLPPEDEGPDAGSEDIGEWLNGGTVCTVIDRGGVQS